MTKRSLFFVLFNGIVSVAYAGVRFPQISRAVQGRANEACAVDPEGCLCTGFCPPLLTCCDNLCVDLQSNPNNCGACNNACPPENGICSDGACESLCMLPEIGCGFDCVDASSDPENCGGCDIADTPCLTPVRIDSALQRPPTVSVARVSSSACPRTWNATGPVLIRPPIPATAEIAELCVLRMMPAATAPAPMSRHATTLAGHAILWMSSMILQTAGGAAMCVKREKSVRLVSAKSRRALQAKSSAMVSVLIRTLILTTVVPVCPEGEPCVDGVCQVEECPPGETDCDGTCVDTTTDPTNCGACGVAVSTPAAVCFVIPKLIVGSARRERLVSTGPAN
ncbi:hypothetical protein KXX29_009703 [Aspergillus fumigatus]|nr:hypothetical protein KXX29_009703 [Aspergillus fumigatus]